MSLVAIAHAALDLGASVNKCCLQTSVCRFRLFVLAGSFPVAFATHHLQAQGPHTTGATRIPQSRYRLPNGREPALWGRLLRRTAATRVVHQRKCRVQCRGNVLSAIARRGCDSADDELLGANHRARVYVAVAVFASGTSRPGFCLWYVAINGGIADVQC